MTQQRSRAFPFTYNYQNEQQLQAFLGNLRASLGPNGPSYYCFGLERAPSTGQEHVQGYVRYQNARTLSSVAKAYPGAHFELAKGTFQQNRDYCAKLRPGDVPNQVFEEAGDKPDIEGHLKGWLDTIEDCATSLSLPEGLRWRLWTAHTELIDHFLEMWPHLYCEFEEVNEDDVMADEEAAEILLDFNGFNNDLKRKRV